MKNFEKYTRILSLLLALALVLVAFAACNPSTAPNDSETVDENPSDNSSAGDGSTDDTLPEDESCAHELTEWIIDENATCAKAGSKHKECVVCKKSVESAVIAPLAHTEAVVEGKATSCSEAGLSAGKVCSVCTTPLVQQEAIPTIGHTEEILEGKAATCTEDGLTYGKKCSTCQAVLVEQEKIDALGHEESAWIIDTVAEIAQNGSKHTECIRCQLPFKTETIPAIDANHTHQAAEWLTVIQPTCAETGMRVLVCACGQTLETATVDMIPHTEANIPGINASCIATGLTSGRICLVCQKTLSAQSVIAMTDHTEEPVLGVSPTCTEGGFTPGKKCSVCTQTTVSSMPLPPNGHNFIMGTCTACGILEPYGLWIVDGQGNPMPDIIVKVMRDGEQVKMYPYSGEFLSMNIESGTYQIVLDLSQLSENYSYDEAGCVLSPDSKTATIRLFKSAKLEEELYFVGYPLSKDYIAYRISEGSTIVSLTPNDYTFFIFSPETPAVYTVTYESVQDVEIGYHGASFFIQGMDLTGESSDVAKYENGISLNVYSSNIGNDYVLGIKSTAATSCIINIKNVGEPGTRIEDAPWIPYLEDSQKVEEQLSLPVSGTYTVIDLTDLSVKAVFNENDGFYHLGSENGPIIYIDLTSNSKFVSSIQTICANQRMGAYIYDINGNIVEKRSYNELFIQYGMPDNTETILEEPVRVPLTDKLAEAVISFGEKNGWWDPTAETNLFTQSLLGAPYNQEYAWLLFCGYYVADPA